MPSAEVVEFVNAALESSIFLAPTEPGLTREELLEIGSQLEFQQGELGDAISGAAAQAFFGKGRMVPRVTSMFGQFHIPEDPDFRHVPVI